MKLRFCFFLVFLIPLLVFSQKKNTYSIEFQKETLQNVISKIEKTFNIRFSYQDNIIQNKTFSLKKRQINLEEILLEIEFDIAVKFQKIDKNNYVILKVKQSLSDIQQLDNVVISNYLTYGISKNKNTSFLLNLEKLTILPGLIETDIIESIQQLPGVVSPNETATGLIVRGGSNDQNRIIWDGINSYHRGHLFGMISAFNPNMAKKVTFYNKGTNPKFGERISSVINIETDNEIQKKIKASIDLNGINASAFLAIPLVNNKLSLQIAARRSYTELYESFTFDELAKKVFQDTKIVNTENTNNDFFFLDYNVKLNYTLNATNQFYFSSFNIENNLDFTVNDNDSQQTSTDLLSIKNDGYSLKWHKKWGDNITQTTLGSFSNYELNYTLRESDEIAQKLNFNKKNIIFDTAINTELSIKTTNSNRLNIGYQFNFKDVSFAFIDISDITLILDNTQDRVTTHAFYSNYIYRNNKLFNFEGGFRVNYYSEFNKLKFEPRFILHKPINKNFQIQITGEIKNQIISEIDETILSDLSLENEIWRLADNETFPIINSHHISTGIIYNNKNWLLDLDFYTKRIEGLTALSLGFLNPLDNAIHLGDQKIKGIDFYLKKKFNKINVWLSYAYSDVKNKFNNINNNTYFTANNAIAHTGSVSFSSKIKKIDFSLGFRVHSGKPFTKNIPVDEFTQRFEGINTERLDFYHRLDFSSTYNFKFQKKGKLKGKIGLSIRNVYDKENPISREFVGNNSINDPIKIVDKVSLGFTPNFLFKVYW